ncbi:MAG: hypothetical protein M1829_005110 [Trizodia sp. TS-e1964]|nr:MAG: hypothetical protein M1829_005110 [Trizodia sp. TS-e1964]
MDLAAINLLRGWPHPSLLPAELVKGAAVEALSTPSIAIPGLEYGPDLGYYPLRVEIANWLSAFYRGRRLIEPDRICITGGASQNLACILQVYSDPIYTRNIWMVAPTYFLACRIFEDAGFHGKLRAVPEDDEGLDIDFLRRRIELSNIEAQLNPRDNVVSLILRSKPISLQAINHRNANLPCGDFQQMIKPARPWSKIYRHIIYAVPTFANPSSKTMSLARRQSLVQIAREFDALVVTDDVYDFLQWSSTQHFRLMQAAQPRVVDVDRFLDGGPGPGSFGNAVSNGSFSKIIGPGMRTGYAESTAKFSYGLSQAGSSHSGGAASQIAATFISRLLSSGALQCHIFDTLQPAYAQRHQIAVGAIDIYLSPLGVTMPSSSTGQTISGGFFLWILLPSPLLATEVVSRALEIEKVIVPAGATFEVQGDSREITFLQNIRISFAWEDPDRLVEGIKRLAQVISFFQGGGLSKNKNQMVEWPLYQ